jgi:hypothetical protein
MVSIHAPVKEATSVTATPLVSVKRFDPRPREGGDPPVRSALFVQRHPFLRRESVIRSKHPMRPVQSSSGLLNNLNDFASTRNQS